MTRSTINRFSLALSVLLACASAACSSDLATYCEKQCDCAAVCNGDEDIDACVAEGESQEEVAAIYGCSEEFDEAVTCIAEERSCEPDSACAAPFARVESCLEGVDYARWSLEDDAP